MPEWELLIAHERMLRHSGRRDLQALNIATYSEWSGEMPQPPAKTSEDRQRRQAIREGNQARREFREGLVRQALGQTVSPVDGAGQFRVNEYGEMVDQQGRIHARSAAHIKAILGRKERQMRGATA